MNELLQQEAVKIASQYKISEKEALKKLLELSQKDIKLQKRIADITDAKQIARFSEYKDFIKKSKKDIYFSLRKFHTDEETEQKLLTELQAGTNPQILTELAKTHASTKERAEYANSFNEELFKVAENANSIIDIGGGLFPVQFAFDKYKNLQNYTWIDKDIKAFKILQEIKNPKLQLFHELIGAHEWSYYGKEFDLALMIKLVPLIYRQDREFINYLAQVPAKQILITGSKESLTKKQSIEHREDQSLKEFIKLTGRKIVREFDIPNEFGYLLE